MPDIVHAFLWRELLNNFGDGLPEFISCTRGRLSEQGLEFGEGQLDGIEVRGIGRQIEQEGVGALDRLTDAIDLVAREIVHDDDIARLESGGKNLLGVGLEGGAVHRPVQHHWGGQAAETQTGDEGGGLPMPPGQRCTQTMTMAGTAAKPGHVGLGTGFINEDKTFRLQPGLPVVPMLTLLRHVGTLLFRRPQGFFYSCKQARAASC